MTNDIQIDSLLPVLKYALREDIGKIDLTSTYIAAKNLNIEADFILKEDAVIAGLPIVEAMYRMLDKDVRFKPTIKDGERAYDGKTIAYVSGPARPILTGERVALNFLGHLSGVATLTGKFVGIVKKYGVRIRDTRKTTPLLRSLEKYAVRAGGGFNHRKGLYDEVLVKDNHLRVEKIAMMNSKVKGKSEIVMAVNRIRQSVQENTVIEVEVETAKQLKDALQCEIDGILLDNMSPEQIRQAVAVRDDYYKDNPAKKKVFLEISGGITLDTVEEYAKTGAEYISVGALTHSAPSINISLEVMR
jgi:nicotinate-nucleotide pyrophosphorylase (carboxylating)